MGSGAKSYMRKGFLIYEEMHKYFPIYEEVVSCNSSILNFLIHEENLFFFFLSDMFALRFKLSAAGEKSFVSIFCQDLSVNVKKAQNSFFYLLSATTTVHAVQKYIVFPVPSRDVTYQTLSGRE